MVKQMSDDDGGTLHWLEAAEVHFLTLLVEYSRDNPGQKVNNCVWQQWCASLSIVLGRPISKDKLVNK